MPQNDEILTSNKVRSHCHLNMFLHSQTSDRLADAAVGEQQARMFRDEFLHLAERVLDYIKKNCESLGSFCKELGSAVDSMRQRNAINCLAGECDNQTLLQVLAASPALICGHEVQKPHPRKCHQDAPTETRSWIFWRTCIPRLNKVPLVMGSTLWNRGFVR